MKKLNVNKRQGKGDTAIIQNYGTLLDVPQNIKELEALGLTEQQERNLFRLIENGLLVYARSQYEGTEKKEARFKTGEKISCFKLLSLETRMAGVTGLKSALDTLLKRFLSGELTPEKYALQAKDLQGLIEKRVTENAVAKAALKVAKEKAEKDNNGKSKAADLAS